MLSQMREDLIKKYNVAGPRYTSYPTVPHWNKNPSISEWKDQVKSAFQQSNSTDGISIYVHLPYCESLCTYCGCNMRVSTNHSVELPYIEVVLKEWELYLSLFDETPQIKEIHLGGGTPTFFSPENLTILINGLTKNCTIAENKEFSFEAHPKNTSLEHLKTLFDLGFTRLSLGIQDFDPMVQDVINRIQPFEMVDEVVKNARAVGYESINFDLIYGLPLQTLSSVEDTINKVSLLRPDRIAFYSYAHVPWDRKMQRKFTEADLPEDAVKRSLYERAKVRFDELGYQEIGMDHFALPNDSLFKAMEDKTLHRNFMGYTAGATQLMIGLGVSSISDTWSSFGQNHKNIGEYKSAVLTGEFPIFRGHILSDSELNTRKHILNLMCHFETSWLFCDPISNLIEKNFEKLLEMESEGLLKTGVNSLKITELGKMFVRNICMLVDPFIANETRKQLFSKTI